MEQKANDVSFSLNTRIVDKTHLDGFGSGYGWMSVSHTPTRRLKELLCDQGWAIIGCNLGDQRFDGSHYKRVGSDNVKSVTLIGLDFDNKEGEVQMSIADALADPFLSTATLGYTSSSHRKYGTDRFRLMWVLESPLSYEAAADVIRAMLERYPAADPAASNPNRIWYGSKASECLLNAPNSLLACTTLDKEFGAAVEASRHRREAFRSSGGGEEVEYMLGLHDHYTDEVGLAIECLRRIPPRIEGGGTYHRCISSLCGLLRHFGTELTFNIVEAAGWHGDWNLEQVVDSLLVTMEAERGHSRANFGTVINHAKAFGLTTDDLTNYRR